MSVVAVAVVVSVCFVVPRVAMLLLGVWCCDQFGGSALLAACIDGHLDVARWLVTDAGSDARSERDKVSCRVIEVVFHPVI